MNSFVTMAGGIPSSQNLEVVKQEVFNFDYPLTSEVKESFEKKFIKYFLYREFGFQDFYRFQFALENYLQEKSPVFNQLYAAYSEMDPYKTNRQFTSNDSTSLSLGASDVKGDSTTDSTTSTDNVNDNTTSNTSTTDNISSQDNSGVTKDSGTTSDSTDSLSSENGFTDTDNVSEGEAGTVNISDTQRLTKDSTTTENQNDSSRFDINDTTNGAQKVVNENAIVGTEQTVVEHEARAASMETENTGKQKNTVSAHNVNNYDYPLSTSLPADGGTSGQRIGEHVNTTDFENHKVITRPALGDAGEETSKDTTNRKFIDGYKNTTTATTDPNSSNTMSSGGQSDDSKGKSETTGSGGESQVSDSTTIDRREDSNEALSGSDSASTTSSNGTSKNESDNASNSSNVSTGSTNDSGSATSLSTDNSVNNTLNKNNQNTLNEQDTAQNSITISEGNTAALVEMYKAYLTAVSNLEYELIKDADELFYQVVRW